MSTDTAVPEIKTLVCDRCLVAVEEHLSSRELRSLASTAELESRMEAMTRSLAVTLSAQFPGVLKTRIQISEQWPKTWWDAFKERWFPQWVLRRCPVEYERIYVDQPIYERVCPHVAIPDEGVHLRWMLNGGDGDERAQS